MKHHNRRHTLLLALVASAALSMAALPGCQSKEPAGADKTAEKPAAADKAAANKPSDKPADKATPGGNPSQPNPDAKPPGDNPTGQAAPDANMPPLGKNDPSFLAGITTKDGKAEGQLWANIETSMGPLTCKLYEQKTPNTVANFVGLARGLKPFKEPGTGNIIKRPFYDGIKFHRVIPKFMVQVGDPTGTGRYNPGYRFADEIAPDLKHTQGGILSMANAGPGTNGSQFFITEVATPHLDGRHAVFGQCNEVDLIKEIARVPTGPGNKPLTPVGITKVTFYRQ